MKCRKGCNPGRRAQFFVARGRGRIGYVSIGGMDAVAVTTVRQSDGLGREIFLMVLGLLVIAFAATVLLREPARSSPEGRKPIPMYGSNPGARGEGGR